MTDRHTIPADSSDPAADLAKASGLFGTPPAQSKQPSSDTQSLSKPPKRAKPTKSAKITTTPPQNNQPCDSTDVNLPQNAPKQPLLDDSAGSDTPDVFNPSQHKYTLQELHDALNLVWSDKSKRYSTIRQIYVALNKYHAIKDRCAGRDAPDSSGLARENSLLTRDQIAQIVSDTLRDGHSNQNLTGSDAKSLTSTLKDLLPDIFGDAKDTKPDPEAVISYITGWSAATGEQIMAELGGREFLAEKLSDLLKVPVSLG